MLFGFFTALHNQLYRGFVCGACLLLSVSVWSLAGANPKSFWVQQANGERFELVQKGHRLLHWQETLDGRPVVLDKGQWYLARLAVDNKLVSTGQLLSAGIVTAKQKPRSESQKPRYQGELPQYVKSSSQQAPVQIRTQPLLVVLVDFADIQISASLAELNERFFGASDSVAAYFKDTSYSRLTLVPAEENDGIANDGFIHLALPSNHPNPGSEDTRSLAKSLLELTQPLVNFGLFDDAVTGRGNGDLSLSADELAVVFVLAGYEASFSGAPPVPNVWGHVDYYSADDLPVVDSMTVGAFSMFGERHGTSFEYHMATKGIICHELGHLILDLPDLYDRVGGSEGNGEWALMSGGSWNNLPGENAGSSPAQMLGWSKARAGFIDITDASSVSTVSLQSASVSEDVKRLWIDPYRHFEYFLLENRQQTGLDVALPGSGLLITHVDERRIDDANDDPAHKLVDIEESHNGLLNSVDTPYGGSVRQFNNQTLPGSRGYDGVANGIDIDNVSSSSEDPMTLDITPRIILADSLGYFQQGAFAQLSLSPTFTSIWTGVRVNNDLAADFFDGLDLYSFAGGQVDIHIAATLSDAMLSNWLHVQSGFVLTSGWNRLLLDERQSFPQGEERFIVLNVSGVAGISVAVDVDNDSAARSYTGSVPSILTVNSAELIQQFLFSDTLQSASNVPLITGQDAIEVNEDSSLLLNINQLNVVDGDSLPEDFVLTVLAGSDYQVENNTITPATNFNGDLSVLVTVSDGTNTSASFNLQVTVNPVNDAPVISGLKAGIVYSVIQGQSLVVFLDALEKSDPEGDLISQLTLLPGENYTIVSNNVVTANADFIGEIQVPITVSDGETASAAFLIPVTVLSKPPEPAEQQEPESVVKKGGNSGSGALFWVYLMGAGLIFCRGKRLN